MPKKTHRISLEVKSEILKKIKEEGMPVSQAVKDYGVSDASIYTWLTKGVVKSAPSWLEVAKLKRENKTLRELVGEVTLKLSESQKKS